MRRWIAAATVTTAALAAIGVLGSAEAQTGPTTTEGRTVTVNGSATKSLPSSAADSTREAAYQAALGRAIDATRGRASFIATRVGVGIGGVQSVVEQSAVDLFCGRAQPDHPISSPSDAKADSRHAAASRKPDSSTAKARPAPELPTTCPQYATVTVTYTIA